MNIDTRNRIISVVLFFIIVVLAWVLVDSIVTPYRNLENQKLVSQQVRQRMSNVRDALIKYNLKFNKFPKDLDSMIVWIKGDSTLSAQADSLFKELPPLVFNIDSMLFSPRTGRRFYYVMIDSIRPNIYVLRDPDTKDQIGDSVKTTLLNAASWE